MLEGIIYYKYIIYLVLGSSLKEKVLKKAHDSPLAGHPSFFKTYQMLREHFAWKGLKDDVLNYVNECPTCHKNKVEHTHPAGLLHPLSIPSRKWESISMEFITILPKLFGKDRIFVVVDRLTKFSPFFGYYKFHYYTSG